MKKIGIVCNLMQGFGGVQLCVIELVKKLNKHEIEPYIISDLKVDEEMYKSMGLRFNVLRVKYSFKSTYFDNKILEKFKDMFYYLKTSWLKEEFDFLYFFEPNVIVDDTRDYLFYLSNSPRSTEVVDSKLSKLKLLFYKIFIKRFIPIFEFSDKNCVINSSYTQKIFSEVYGKKIEVVYPPSSLSLIDFDSTKKEKNSVVVFSRIAPAKRQDMVLDLAIKYSDFNFYIVGAVSDADMLFYEGLIEKKVKNQIKNIFFEVNMSLDLVKNRLLGSEYYLFFAKNEHFGITTVEAICSGCLPIVHNSGGQVDIVKDEFLRFDDPKLIEKFEQIIHLPSKVKKDLLNDLQDHVKINFLDDVFGKKLMQYLNK